MPLNHLGVHGSTRIAAMSNKEKTTVILLLLVYFVNMRVHYDCLETETQVFLNCIIYFCSTYDTYKADTHTIVFKDKLVIRIHVTNKQSTKSQKLLSQFNFALITIFDLC